jgi:hypothetical protein
MSRNSGRNADGVIEGAREGAREGATEASIQNLYTYNKPAHNPETIEQKPKSSKY